MTARRHFSVEFNFLILATASQSLKPRAIVSSSLRTIRDVLSSRARFETYRNARNIESEPTVRSNESFHILLVLEIRRIVGRSLSWSVAHVIRIHKAHAFKRKCDFELSRVVLSVARWVPVPSRCAAFARAHS